jgi:hypothetical protein
VNRYWAVLITSLAGVLYMVGCGLTVVAGVGFSAWHPYWLLTVSLIGVAVATLLRIDGGPCYECVRLSREVDSLKTALKETRP